MWIFVSAGILTFGVLSAAGCGRRSSGANSSNCVFSVGDTYCSVEEARVIILQFQKDYAALYGIDTWTSDVLDQTELAKYIKNNAASQLARVYELDLAGEGLGIEISEAEEKQAQVAASEYLDSLTSEEKKYLDISESELSQLFVRYLLARRTYGEVTRDVSTEVSDDEALVMDMLEISVWDQSLAEDLYERILDGDDFTALAQSYSQNDDTQIAVSRYTFDEDVTDCLFSLQEGECSSVVEIDGLYCLFLCETYYDEQKTEQNKANIVQLRRDRAVDEACALYVDPGDSVLHSDVYAETLVDPTLELAGPSFREVFQKYFL